MYTHYAKHCFFFYTLFCQPETEVVVESGNVNVMDKMTVSGYDVKVSGINQQVNLPIMSAS